MVGVPQNRGCLGCRRQKKKCIGFTSPPCERCKRLQIACKGSGEQRFTFKDENPRFVVTTNRTKPGVRHDEVAADNATDTIVCSPATSTTSTTHYKGVIVEHEDSVDLWEPGAASTAIALRESIPLLRSVPASRLGRLIASFTADINPQFSSGIQLPWNFGPFIEEIPRRLGHNEALDASTEAVMAAYAAFKSKGTQALVTSRDRSTKSYVRALQAMRKTLNDDEKAGSSETLCSAMMMLIVETLSGPDNGRVLSHAGGAAQILKARGYHKPRNPFEAKILLSLRGPVIMQALFDETCLFTDAEWRDVIQNPIEGDGVDNRVLQTMAQLPNLMHAIRAAYSAAPVDYPALATAALKLAALLAAHVPNRVEVVDRLKALEAHFVDPLLMPPELSVLHSHFSRQVGIAYATEILVLLILSAAESPMYAPGLFVPGQTTHDAHQLAAARCASEVADLADRVTQHRPLGTVYMSFVLRAAHAAALDREFELRVEGQLWSFAEDMYGDSADIRKTDLRELREYLSCRDLRMWHPEKGYYVNQWGGRARLVGVDAKTRGSQGVVHEMS